MLIYCQKCVSILNRSSICVCMGFYSNSIIFMRLRCRQQLRSHQCCILMLRSTNRCCTQHLIACLLSTMCQYTQSIIYLCMHGLLLKFNHIQPGFHRSCVMENILYIDAQIYESMLYTVFDCVSSVNDVLVYLVDHLFVYVWAVTQIQSYSTGFSPVLRHGTYPRD